MALEIEKMDTSHFGLEDKQEVFYAKKKPVELPEPNTLDNMVEGLRILFAEDRVDVDQVKKYMGEYKSNPTEWQNYAKFDPHRLVSWYRLI